jgi:hypothetical protein
MSGRPSATAARRAPARPRGARLDSRVARLRASHHYGGVLSVVIAAFFFSILAPDERWAGSTLVLLLGATLVCALFTAGVARASSQPSVVLVVAATAMAVVNLTIGGRASAGAVQVFAGLLAIANVIVIGRGVIDQGEVNFDSIRGAVAVYVLLGLVFTFFYGAIAILDHAPFFAQGTDGTRAVRAYFSYVTLATLGYGDYAATGTLARALAVSEALLGQLYLVTVVTVLVSRLRGSNLDRDPLIPPG